MADSPGQSQDDPVLAVTFRLTDETYPFVAVSQAESCTIELAEMIPRGEGTYAEFFNVSDAEPEKILSRAGERETIQASLLRAYEDGGLFEFQVAGDCPAITLAELGAFPRQLRGDCGDGTIVAEIPPDCESGSVIQEFLAAHPGAELAAKRRRGSVGPIFSPSNFQQVAHERLTDRQREVVEAAVQAGYYEWPREATGAEVADQLEISSATFSEHVHAAERKLLGMLFDAQ